MVAHYARATNLIVPDVAAAVHKLEVLRGHCDDLARDYDSIEKTAMAVIDPLDDVDAFLASAETFSAAEIQHLHVRAPGGDASAFVERFGDPATPPPRGRCPASTRGLPRAC